MKNVSKKSILNVSAAFLFAFAMLFGFSTNLKTTTELGTGAITPTLLAQVAQGEDNNCIWNNIDCCNRTGGWASCFCSLGGC